MDVQPIVYSSLNIKNNRSEEDIALYLGAECGEVADWLLNPSKRKEDLLGECADVIICAVDLAIQHKINQFPNMTPEVVARFAIRSLEEQIVIKSKKWLDKQKSEGEV